MTMRDSIKSALVSGAETKTEGPVLFAFRFSAGDPTFAGHFPNRPLLPGIFQLEITRLTAELVLQTPLAVRAITKAKFLRPIIPDETVCVELKLVEKPDTIQVRTRFSVTGQPAGEAILELSRVR